MIYYDLKKTEAFIIDMKVLVLKNKKLLVLKTAKGNQP